MSGSSKHALVKKLRFLPNSIKSQHRIEIAQIVSPDKISSQNEGGPPSLAPNDAPSAPSQDATPVNESTLPNAPASLTPQQHEAKTQKGITTKKLLLISAISDNHAVRQIQLVYS